MSRKPKEEISDREYPITLYRAEEGGFVAEHRDLPGCLTQGETLEEALTNLNSARRLWIATATKHGDDIPMPSTDEKFGGRVLVRMPKSLHRRLVEHADREGVSLNQLVVARLAEAAQSTALEKRAQGIERSLADLKEQLAATAIRTQPVAAAIQPGVESVDLAEMAEIARLLPLVSRLSSLANARGEEQWASRDAAKRARPTPRNN